MADLRGERVRVYSDKTLREKVHAKFPTAIKWEPIGIPENYLPLIAEGRKAFIPEEKRTVSHGGNSIEELIVPLIKIERKDK